MTNSRAKPSGWTDNNTSISAAQINTIDVNQARSVDGAGGGTYSGAIVWTGTHEFDSTLQADGAATFNAAVTLSDSVQVDSGSTFTVGSPSTFTGYIRQHYSTYRQEFYPGIWPTDYPGWNEGGTGGSASIAVVPSPSRLLMLSGATATNNYVTGFDNNKVEIANGFDFEFVAMIEGSISDVKWEVSVQNGVVELTSGSGYHGVGVAFDSSIDTNWVLTGMSGTTLTRVDSGVAVVVDTPHRFRVEVGTDGSAALFIDGAAACTFGVGIIGVGRLRPVFFVETQTSADRTASVEMFQVWQPASA